MFHHDYDMLTKLLPTTPGNPFISFYFNVADPELSCTKRLDLAGLPSHFSLQENIQIKEEKPDSCPSTKTAGDLSPEGRMAAVVLSNGSRCTLAA